MQKPLDDKKNVAEENEIKIKKNLQLFCVGASWSENECSTHSRGERESEKYIYLIKNPAFLSSQGSFYALCTHTHMDVYTKILPMAILMQFYSLVVAEVISCYIIFVL